MGASVSPPRKFGFGRASVSLRRELDFVRGVSFASAKLGLDKGVVFASGKIGVWLGLRLRFCENGILAGESILPPRKLNLAKASVSPR